MVKLKAAIVKKYITPNKNTFLFLEFAVKKPNEIVVIVITKGKCNPIKNFNPCPYGVHIYPKWKQ